MRYNRVVIFRYLGWSERWALPALLAHGAFGEWDELIFLGVVVIFIAIMGVVWVRSRNTEYEFDQDTASADTSPDEQAAGDRFRLD
jgi:hypothetical protein